jgi:hypothetical protein
MRGRPAEEEISESSARRQHVIPMNEGVIALPVQEQGGDGQI